MKSNFSAKGVALILVLLAVIFYLLITKTPNIYDPSLLENLADPGKF